MNMIWCLCIGAAAAAMGRRVMRERCFGRVDDLLLGVLGAVLGDSIADDWGLMGIGGRFLIAATGAALLLMVTGLPKDERVLSKVKTNRRPKIISSVFVRAQKVKDRKAEGVNSSRTTGRVSISASIKEEQISKHL